MQESATATTENMELIYWGYLASRDVYSSDGRLVGLLRGIMIDKSMWTIPLFVVEVDKDILEELNIQKPMLSTALVNIPTTYVKSASDIVQLNADLASMRGVVTIYYAE